LGDPFCVEGKPAAEVILDAALASRADNDDTIDLAVLKGVKDPEELKSYQIVHFTPFDPVHKRTEASVKGKDGKSFKVTKGAPQVILALAENGGHANPAVEKAVSEFAARGFRSLGVARADEDGAWHLVGVIPLFDPPRDDAKAVIASALAMGVKVKMVTGDALAIAKETAKKLGMGTNILDAGNLGDSKKQESAEVTAAIDNADGFAEVFPEHKYHIVDVLQKLGHIVGMTGDGVNDAPALKKADCGFAVSTATDAARAAASIVLTTPGLSVIIESIKESRRIFQRMNSYAIYRIAETLRVLLFVTAAILIFNFFPLTAVMIVMLALLNDGAILTIAYDNVHYSDRPEAWNMHLVLGVATVLGIVGPIAAFGLFYIGDQVFHFSHTQLQPMMYLMLSVAGHMTIFLTRTRGPFWSIAPAPALWIACLGTQILATCIAVFGFLMPALDWRWAAAIWGYAVIWALLSDRIKLLAYRIFDSPKAAEAAKAEGVAARASAESKAKDQPDPKAGAKPDVKPVAKAPPAPDAKAEAKPENEAAPAPDAKAAAAPDAKAEVKAAPAPDVKGAEASEEKPKPPFDLTPKLVERVHALYEELGRQDVIAVQELERAQKTSKEETVP